MPETTTITILLQVVGLLLVVLDASFFVDLIPAKLFFELAFSSSRRSGETTTNVGSDCSEALAIVVPALGWLGSWAGLGWLA